MSWSSLRMKREIGCLTRALRAMPSRVAAVRLASRISPFSDRCSSPPGPGHRGRNSAPARLRSPPGPCAAPRSASPVRSGAPAVRGTPAGYLRRGHHIGGRPAERRGRFFKSYLLGLSAMLACLMAYVIPFSHKWSFFVLNVCCSFNHFAIALSMMTRTHPLNLCCTTPCCKSTVSFY